MNNSEFVLVGDGWVQVTPCGEFPHVSAGVTQVIDRAACDAIVADFNARKADANFPGVLVDFDHFSLDTEQSSEAAGWITELESRDTGLLSRVRWPFVPYNPTTTINNKLSEMMECWKITSAASVSTPIITPFHNFSRVAGFARVRRNQRRAQKRGKRPKY